jgi:hypothetical protein
MNHGHFRPFKARFRKQRRWATTPLTPIIKTGTFIVFYEAAEASAGHYGSDCAQALKKACLHERTFSSPVIIHSNFIVL